MRKYGRRWGERPRNPRALRERRGVVRGAVRKAVNEAIYAKYTRRAQMS